MATKSTTTAKTAVKAAAKSAVKSVAKAAMKPPAKPPARSRAAAPRRASAAGPAPAALPAANANRREDILVAAAQLFSEKGFEGATMRDIASAVNMLSGSLFYHFSSKEELFFAVYEAGITQMTRAVQSALEKETDPWKRLEAAAVAHLQTLLKSPFSAAIAPGLSLVAARLRPSLIASRNEYDDLFKSLLEALPLPSGVNRRLMRLQILGALNWTPYWYQEDRTHSPAQIARHLVAMLRQQIGPSLLDERKRTRS
ncbi:TetR/AcrR family transcriptional regulator [Ramlibacter sp.]|uniref:TetR/AcrR family transcriptional regulator n=1 Tax=Ramlibacter sp. TaxID=1917967 RepID=UPI003D127A58